MEEKELDAILKERFAQLPKVVQDAITSADVSKHLREMAETQKLHLDQWETLENEVMMTLFGVIPVDELQTNIQKQVGVSEETAKTLTENISKIVFEPIRTELERSLESVGGKAEDMGDVEAPISVPIVAPATPPSLPPTEKSVRAPISEAYKSGEPSSARRAVEDDPYRESLT